MPLLLPDGHPKLYDLKFTYEKGIPLSFYLSVYTDSNKKVWELMKDTNEFLLDIYNTNSKLSCFLTICL